MLFRSLAPVPIVALTADAMEASFQKALDAGCSAYLTKPVKKILFLEAISKYAGNGETLHETPHTVPKRDCVDKKDNHEN